MKNKSVVVFALVSAIVIFIAATYAYKTVESKKLEEKISSVNLNAAPYVREHSMKFGQNEKNVIVVEFLDPECGSCAAFHPAVKKVLHDYNKEIQLVVRYMPNHKNASMVVKILEAARKQGKYEETLNMVFASQNIWGEHGNPKPHLLWNYIVQIEGLDITKLREDMNDPKFVEMMEIDMQDAKELGVTGTPTFFVNGKKLDDLSFKALNALVEAEIYK
ncbi:MAG: thioredoxin domain-containing protein [Arcobacteraceae bacterium]